jgi:cytochrome c-type biogenesis protein CcmI
VLAALTVIALFGAVMPLLRKPHVQNQRSEYDLEVYRHQLEELQNELERGVITAEEESAARLEIERRILVTAEMEDSIGGSASSAPQIIGVLIVAISIPALASGLYLYIGNPQAPDHPLAARTPVETAQSASAGDLETVISRLQARLARDTGSLADWLLLGQSYNVMRRYEEAIAAYRRADGLKPDDVNIMTSLGETLVLAASGTVTPEAQSIFRNAHHLDKNTPGPRFYLGLARAQAGDFQEAYDFWLALANDAPADATWLPQVVARLEEVGAEIGMDVAAALKSDLTSVGSAKRMPLPGPTRKI